MPTEFDQLIRMSEFEDFDLLDYNLVNTEDEDLGEIEELIVDLAQGQVTYAVADFGGFLGLAETSTAIPWDRFQIDQEDENFVLDVDEETLANAPEFDLDAWDDTDPAPDWDVEIREYWEQQ